MPTLALRLIIGAVEDLGVFERGLYQTIDHFHI